MALATKAATRDPTFGITMGRTVMPALAYAREIFPRVGSADYAAGMPDEFGDVLAALIAAKGLTGRQFAKLVGAQQSVISRIISGERTPNPKRLRSWGTALGQTGDALSRFIELGKSARAKGKKDSSGHIHDLEARLEKAQECARTGQVLLTSLVQILADNGTKVPHEFEEKLRRFEHLVDAI